MPPMPNCNGVWVYQLSWPLRTLDFLHATRSVAGAEAIEAKCSPEVREAFRCKPPERCGCATIQAKSFGRASGGLGGDAGGDRGGGVLTEVSQARGNRQSIASGYAVGVGVLLARLCGQPATPSGSLTMPIRARSPVRQADPERTFDVLLARVTFRLLFCVLVPTELLQAVTGARYPW